MRETRPTATTTTFHSVFGEGHPNSFSTTDGAVTLRKIFYTGAGHYLGFSLVTSQCTTHNTCLFSCKVYVCLFSCKVHVGVHVKFMKGGRCGFSLTIRKIILGDYKKTLQPSTKALPYYIGGILRTPTQNISCIYRRDFAYPYAKLLLYIWAAQIAYPHARKNPGFPIYIGEILRTPYAKSLLYIWEGK